MERYRVVAQGCAAERLRRASRTANRFYAESLKSSELTGNQFSLLVAITLRGPVAIGGLSAVTLIDRTTLTRNLRLLEEKKLVKLESANDQRQQLVSISSQGLAMVDKAESLWREAQTSVKRKFGAARLGRLLAELNEFQLAIEE